MSNILLLAIIVGTANATTWFIKLPLKPSECAHKEGCYIKVINDVVPFGTTLSLAGLCNRIHCSSTIIEYNSCAVYTSDNILQITDVDLSKPYPECCPKIVVFQTPQF